MRKCSVFFLFLFLLFPYTRPRYGGELKLELPASGNPLFWDGLLKDSLAFSNIFYLDSRGKPWSFLFSRWWEEQGRWYFKLKEGILYADATPILPQDIANSINSFIHSNRPGALSLRNIIKSIGVEPPDRVVIEVASSANLPLLLSTPYLFLRREGKYSGPFVPRQDNSFEANPFFPGGRAFLDRVLLVYPPEIPDMSFTQGFEARAAFSVSYLVYLMVSPRKWRKLSRRAIFSLLSSLSWKTRADSYLPSQLSQFSLDFPLIRLRRVRGYLRRKVILAVSPALASMAQELKDTASLARVKLEANISENPLGELLAGRANAALFPSQAAFVGSEAEEVVGMIERYGLERFYPYLGKLKKKILLYMGEDEKKLERVLSSTYEYMASREFFFPVAVARQPVYLKKSFLPGGKDFYGRPLMWKIRRALSRPDEGKTDSSPQAD